MLHVAHVEHKPVLIRVHINIHLAQFRSCNHLVIMTHPESSIAHAPKAARMLGPSSRSIVFMTPAHLAVGLCSNEIAFANRF